MMRDREEESVLISRNLEEGTYSKADRTTRKGGFSRPRARSAFVRRFSNERRRRSRNENLKDVWPVEETVR